MQVPATIFREYDIRGTVGDQLTGEVAHAIGKAFATLAAERLGRAPRIAVGRDNRPSGADFAANVLSGIEDAGALALFVGMVPTPALYFATHTLTVDGGLQAHGSHNPPPPCPRTCTTCKPPCAGRRPSSGSRSTATAIGSGRWTSRGASCSATSCWCCWVATWRAAWARGTL